jgi:trimethylamine:corrinoid methyltransferase-like protein
MPSFSDGQSLAERCLGGLILAQSGGDIMGRADELEAAKIISPTQLTVDNELAAMIKHLLAPLPVNAHTMVWEDLLGVAPGGHFLDKPSTRAHYREAFRSMLFKHNSREVWESNGAKDLIKHARQKTLDAWNAQPDTKWLAY